MAQSKSVYYKLYAVSIKIMPSFEDLPVDDISRRNQLEGAYEKEVLEAAIEASLENSVKCNEGKNALILHLDLASLDKESIDQLLSAGVPEKGQLASKVLKIYVPGEAQKEAGKQEQARRILAESGSDEAAAVPGTGRADRGGGDEPASGSGFGF